MASYVLSMISSFYCSLRTLEESRSELLSSKNELMRLLVMACVSFFFRSAFYSLLLSAVLSFRLIFLGFGGCACWIGSPVPAMISLILLSSLLAATARLADLSLDLLFCLLLIYCFFPTI